MARGRSNNSKRGFAAMNKKEHMEASRKGGSASRSSRGSSGGEQGK